MKPDGSPVAKKSSAQFVLSWFGQDGWEALALPCNRVKSDTPAYRGLGPTPSSAVYASLACAASNGERLVDALEIAAARARLAECGVDTSAMDDADVIAGSLTSPEVKSLLVVQKIEPELPLPTMLCCDREV